MPHHCRLQLQLTAVVHWHWQQCLSGAAEALAASAHFIIQTPSIQQMRRGSDVVFANWVAGVDKARSIDRVSLERRPRRRRVKSVAARASERELYRTFQSGPTGLKNQIFELSIIRCTYGIRAATVALGTAAAAAGDAIMTPDVQVASGAVTPANGCNLTLHTEAKHGRTAVVQLLLQAGAAVDAADAQGCTALHLAAQQGHQCLSK